jgi:hypothetical protein
MAGWDLIAPQLPKLVLGHIQKRKMVREALALDFRHAWGF